MVLYNLSDRNGGGVVRKAALRGGGGKGSVGKNRVTPPGKRDGELGRVTRRVLVPEVVKFLFCVEWA